MLVETDNELNLAIDRTMQYYALFRYPLQVHEIRKYCQVPCSEEEVLRYLNEQLAVAKLYSLEAFYAVSPDIAEWIQRRIQGAQKAVQDIRRAKRAASFIYQFPFVCFVGISGSLSKNFSDSHTDYDFFIITQENRLWIGRTLLHLLKKLSFLFGQQHKLCMNYFIDESAIVLEEQNIYTATEISSMIPVCGTAVYRRFMQANSWIQHLLPNYKQQKAEALHDKNSLMKRIISNILNIMNPTGFNRFLMRLTDTKWRKKWAAKAYPAEDYDLAFKTTLHVSKNHPANYQKKILEALTPKSQ